MNKTVINLFGNAYDKVLIWHRRQTEINKFKDKRRVSITDSVQLSKEQKKEIDVFYKKNYGAKIPYTWHQHYTAFTGKFDVKYFPELLYIPEFEHFINLWPSYNTVFSDKNILPLLCNPAKVKYPNNLFSSVRGALRDGDGRSISHKQLMDGLNSIGEVFIKKTIDSSSGRGCFLANLVDGVDTKSGESLNDIISSLGSDFVVQERIKCHNTISSLYPNSVNTFRVMTYRWHDSIVVVPATMRIGRGGSYLDNIHSGGMCIAIDDDGKLHEAAYTEFGESYTKHPDSQVVFKDWVIEGFSEVLDSAKRLHETLPQVGCVHWDFTIDAIGNPLLIEANMSGTSIQLIQRPRGCGAFGDNTAEILQWMRVMKHTKIEKRNEIAFGNI